MTTHPVSRFECLTDLAHPRRGAALLVVLVFVTLISNLAIAALRVSVSGAAAATVFTDQMRADELGRDAAQLVAYHLQSDLPGVRRGGSFIARLPFSSVDIQYVAETARIDINLAPPKLLAALFVAAGADRDLADQLASRAEWSQGRKQPTSPRPAALDSSPTAANGAALVFVRTEQIIDAWGVPEPLYRTIRPALTVASRSAKVDPVLADRLVVTALMEGDEERANDFLERRRRGFATVDDALIQLPAATRPYAGFPPVRAVKVIARVAVDHRFRRTYEFVITVPEGPKAETRVLSWQPLDL
ncbi:hypothetical protein [Tardiphaga sp.]|uniref:hypothetical protein n=1 Tax=Tardiphaga sp. TaxID=1926292 RepID=UPI00352B35AA